MHRHALDQMLGRIDGNVLEFVGDDIDGAGELVEAHQIVIAPTECTPATSNAGPESSA